MPVTLCFLVFSAIQAKADMTAKDYQAIMASSNALHIALTKECIRGLGQGMQWASGAAKEDGFCTPPGLALNVENLIDIIEGEIKAEPTATSAEAKPKTDGTPIGLLLLNGLRKTFPCPKGK